MELGQGTKVDEAMGGRSPSGDDDKRHLHDDEGTRQPYNCAFCKRGFPTAQALGGHMNVHRKDRSARAATPPSTVAASRGAYDSLTGHDLQAHPASGSDQAATAGSLLKGERGAPPQELRLFGHLAGAGVRGKEGGDAKDGDGDHGEQGEEELDLELRLGAAGQ